jgi:photosystem II stability/assembly factor-like uncharacterized protein
MSDVDLEQRLRSYYRTFEPRDSARLKLASSAFLERQRHSRPGFSFSAGLRLAGTLAAGVLVAALVLARFGGNFGPAAPRFDPAIASRASVEHAGLMSSGGIWAVAGSYLLTSTDGGSTWHASNFPAGVGWIGPVFALDPQHVWVVDLFDASYSGPAANPTPTGGTLYLQRTGDGGKTWQQSSVSGDFECPLQAMSFVDAEHGFILCSAYGTPESEGNDGTIPATQGSGTLLRTVDGGATWQVVSRSVGPSMGFTASDAHTLWAADDYESSTRGLALHVSRDAGVSWSTVELPELTTLASLGGSDASVAAGPTFVDASNGTLALAVIDPNEPRYSVWFYHTSDAGRTWSLVKKEAPVEDGYMPIVAVGRQWAMQSSSGQAVTVSGDLGATWTEVDEAGLPGDAEIVPRFAWLDFADADHAALVLNRADAPSVLMLSSDGGRSWRPADFGDARAKVPANSTLDPATAEYVASWFEAMARRDPAAPYAAPDTQQAWQALSPYSQRAFGSIGSFEAAEATTMGTRQIGSRSNAPDVLNREVLGEGLWNDLNATADMSRAYVVDVTFPGTEVAPDRLVVAPLASTGEWRVWVVTMPASNGGGSGVAPSSPATTSGAG